MNLSPHKDDIVPTDIEDPIERVPYDFGLNRRAFVQVLGAGLAIVAGPMPAPGQPRGGGRDSGRVLNVAARIHRDGVVTDGWQG
jgi:hypothetical protein